MNEAVVSAVITGVFAVIISVINSHYQSNATRKLIEYRMNQLEKKQDKHNNVIERMYELERKQSVIEEQIDVANHRIKDLEQKG